MPLRLTLRTLLAYLDQVLGKEDMEVLSQKIAESPKANQLKGRLQQILDRVDLNAASPNAEGAEDANLAAEYLDNTLPDDQVAIFEQACLTSVPELAEVADAHRILSNVLTRPMQVPVNLRERVYRMQRGMEFPLVSGEIGSQRAPVDYSSSSGTNSAQQSAINKHRANGAQLPPIPKGARTMKTPLPPPIEYGVEGANRRLASIFVTVGLLVLFFVVLTMTVKPLFFRLADQSKASDTKASDAKVSDAKVFDAKAIDKGEQQEKSRPQDPVKDSSSNYDVPVFNEPPKDKPQPRSPDKSQPPQSAVEPIVERPEPDPRDSSASVKGTPAPAVVEEPVEPKVPMEPKPVVRNDVGALVSEKSLLFVKKMDESWSLARKDEPLTGPLTVVTPELFRSRMVLAGGIDMNLVGATEVFLEPTDVSPTLRLRSGRLVLGTTSADNRILLQTPEVAGEIMLADLRSLVALELAWRRPPGTDPEKPGASIPTLRLMCVQGSVHWKRLGSDPVALEVGKQWSAIGKQQGAFSVAAEFPWIDPPAITTDLNEYARRGLLEQVGSVAKPPTALLREAMTNRRGEVVMLAGKTLLQLGEPEMYFGSDGLLSRVSQKAYWKDHFLALQEAIDRSPEGASQVREAAQKLNTVEADILYRLLWGFSNEQLSRGEDARLVDLLDHPNLAVRVLAIENLRMITGTTLNYRPENEGRRTSEIAKWQARQRREGGIRWTQ